MGSRVRIAGWVEDVRVLGSLIFLTIRDVMGSAQAVLNKKNAPSDVFEKAKGVPRQSAVVVEGVVKESRAEKYTVEVQAQTLHVLSEAVHPLSIDPTGRVPASIDARLDVRALDLRNPATRAVFIIRHRATQSIRRTLLNEGFIEVHTAKVIGSATEGGANLFAIDYFGRRAYLAQSPQLYKEQLTLSLDRVFEVGTYYRAEKSHTRRHLSEFVSVDIEAAFMDDEDVMKVCEDVVVSAVKDVAENCASELRLLGHTLAAAEKPFERVTYERAVDELKKEGHGIEKGGDLTDHALRVLSRSHPNYYWVTDWPVELKPFYIAPKKSEPRLTRSFDLLYKHIELASGGLRVSSRGQLTERLMQQGLDPKDFSAHLKAFDWGMPPHAGWGFGLDRFIMVLTGKENIREAVLWPRDRFRLTP